VIHSTEISHVQPQHGSESVNKFGELVKNLKSLLQILVMPSQHHGLTEKSCQEDCIGSAAGDPPAGQNWTTLNPLGWVVPKISSPRFGFIVKTQGPVRNASGLETASREFRQCLFRT